MMQALVQLILLYANTSDAQIVVLEDKGAPKVVKDYLHCLEFCKMQVVSIYAFKFIGIRLDQIKVLPKTTKALLSKCMDEAS